MFKSDSQICDVFLGERDTKFSDRHFHIAFNDREEIIFENTSRLQAQVNYNNEDPPCRNQFTWILFGTYKNIKITVSNLIFKVKWADYGTHLAKYEAHRDAYFEECRKALPPLCQLGMESQQTTTMPTALHSPRQESPKRPPGQQPIYLLEEELGRGGSDTVHKTVDVSTGDMYAAKKFRHDN